MINIAIYSLKTLSLLVLILKSTNSLIIKSSSSPKSFSALEVPEEFKAIASRNRSPKIFSHPKVYRCDDEGKDLVVNFVNLNYPDNDDKGTECKFRMIITSPQICQIRVDFVDTEMLKPVRGECLSQQFEAEGPIWPSGLPPLCGRQNDQHFYLHLEQWNSNFTYVDFKLTTVVGGEGYRFGVWLTQIDCSTLNILKAPEGCTQYFLGEKGVVKSFNFEGFRYLNSQNYRVCIRAGKGVCGARYDTNVAEFGLRKTISSNSKLELYQQSGAGATECSSDYILIPGGREYLVKLKRSGKLFFRRRKPAAAAAPAPQVALAKISIEKNNNFDRFCGGKLAPLSGSNDIKPIFAPVRSNLITFDVKTSSISNDDLANSPKTGNINSTLGFKLNYFQLRECLNKESDFSVPLILKEEKNKDEIFRNELVRDTDELVSSILSEPLFTNITTSNLTNKNEAELESSNFYGFANESDKIWDYLDDSSEHNEDEYDFLK